MIAEPIQATISTPLQMKEFGEILIHSLLSPLLSNGENLIVCSYGPSGSGKSILFNWGKPQALLDFKTRYSDCAKSSRTFYAHDFLHNPGNLSPMKKCEGVKKIDIVEHATTPHLKNGDIGILISRPRYADLFDLNTNAYFTKLSSCLNVCTNELRKMREDCENLETLNRHIDLVRSDITDSSLEARDRIVRAFPLTKRDAILRAFESSREATAEWLSNQGTLRTQPNRLKPCALEQR